MAETTDESKSMRPDELIGLSLSFRSAKDDSLVMLSFESPA